MTGPAAIRRAAVALAAALSCAAPAPAQDAAALPARERQLAARAAPGLHALADAFEAQRQHRRALELRREIWLEYDEHDARARERCGFVRVGDLWRKHGARLVLDQDLKADARRLHRIEQEQAALAKALGDEHRALAAAWQQAGDQDRARRHWQRVLRFAPGDRQAEQALARQTFEGFAGTPAEIALLRRGRALRGASDWLVRTAFPTDGSGPGQHPLLAAAGIPHLGVRAEHFTVWGTLAPAELATIAADCERALLLARTLFGTAGGTVFAPATHRDLVFVHDPAHYAALLDGAAAQFSPERLLFLKNEVDQAFVDHGESSLRVHKAHLGLDAARDQAVRGIVQDASGVLSDGLYEGIGHLACGLLSGRTLTFLLEQEPQQTAASWTARRLVPELAVWQQIAEESAWAKSDTRTSELVLLSGARFTAEQRVKAWAICHWFAHGRPELILELDRSRSAEIRTPPDVEAEFRRRTGVDLPRIDHEWREFWARGAALRAAIAADPVPADNRSAERPARLRARSLVDAVDAQRAAARQGPAGFFVATGADVQAARRWEQELAAVEALRQQRPKVLPPLPEPPPALGRTLLWSRAAAAEQAVATWLARPAWRDRLLHPGRDLFGAAVGGPSWLLDVGSPATATRGGPPSCWPRHGQRNVPGSAAVGDLGPRVAAALAAAGVPPDARVGPALTLHCWRAVDTAVLIEVGCRVRLGEQELPVVRVDIAGAGDDGDRAYGCAAFVPLRPLPSGARVEVQWRPGAALPGEDQVFAPVVFTVQ